MKHDDTPERLATLTAQLTALDRLTDAKFATFRTVVDAESERAGLALAAAEKAIDKAELATEKRFESVNGFRAQLADQVASFATRENVEIINASLRERIDTLTSQNHKLITDMTERTRIQLDEVKAQAGRMALALMSTVVGTLVSALVVILVTRN